MGTGLQKSLSPDGSVELQISAIGTEEGWLREGLKRSKEKEIRITWQFIRKQMSSIISLPCSLTLSIGLLLSFFQSAPNCCQTVQKLYAWCDVLNAKELCSLIVSARQVMKSKEEPYYYYWLDFWYMVVLWSLRYLSLLNPGGICQNSQPKPCF